MTAFADQHGFDAFPVGQAEEELARSVAGARLGPGLQATDEEMRRQRFAQRFGQIGHAGKIVRLAAVDPPENLGGVEAPHPAGGKPVLKRPEGQLIDIYFVRCCKGHSIGID